MENDVAHSIEYIWLDASSSAHSLSIQQAHRTMTCNVNEIPRDSVNHFQISNQLLNSCLDYTKKVFLALLYLRTWNDFDNTVYMADIQKIFDVNLQLISDHWGRFAVLGPL